MNKKKNGQFHETDPRMLSEETLEQVGGGYSDSSRAGDWCYNLETQQWEYRDRSTGKVLKKSSGRPW